MNYSVFYDRTVSVHFVLCLLFLADGAVGGGRGRGEKVKKRGMLTPGRHWQMCSIFILSPDLICSHLPLVLPDCMCSSFVLLFLLCVFLPLDS